VPPITETEVAADQALDSKLEAAFASETAATPSDTPAEEEAGPEPEVEAEETEEETEETEEEPEAQARDEKGRFVPKSQDPRLATLLEKYDGDVEKALLGAVEAQGLVGRQGQEVGELRRQLEEVQRTLQKPRYDSSALAQLIEDDPGKATALAYQAGDTATTAAALEAWKDADPFAAALWVTNQQQAEYARQIEERLTTATQPLQERVADQDYKDALTDFARKHPDVDQYLETMGEIAKETPHIIKMLAEDPSVEIKVEAYDYLYTKARGRVGDTLASAAQEAAQEDQQAQEAAKQQAAVASATSSTETTKKRPVDEWHEQFTSFLKDDSTSLSKGLTGQQ
jgi:hypothetical protein